MVGIYQNLPESTRIYHLLVGHDFSIFFGTYYISNYLVGGIPTPLKNMKVSWDYYSQLNGKS